MERVLGEFWSGGSGGAGGGASPEVGDGGLRPKARSGMAQRDCIEKRVREKLTFFKIILVKRDNVLQFVKRDNALQTAVCVKGHH